jgi:WD repeat-containing protein 91
MDNLETDNNIANSDNNVSKKKGSSFTSNNISIDNDSINDSVKERTPLRDNLPVNNSSKFSDTSNNDDATFVSDSNSNSNAYNSNVNSTANSINNNSYDNIQIDSNLNINTGTKVQNRNTSTSSSFSSPKRVSREQQQNHNLQSEYDDLPHVDELVQEYLLYRGFTRTFHRFQEDRKADQLLGLNVARIVDQLFYYIRRYDMPGLLSLWAFLNARFFYHLDSNFRSVVLEFELALKRFYVINTIQTNRKEEAVNFFKEYCADLNIVGTNNNNSHTNNESYHSSASFDAENVNGASSLENDGNHNTDASWKGWFALPFLPHPERSPQFHKYFDQSWSNTLKISLQNFLNLILQNTPLPKLMAFNIGRVQRYEQECIIESQKAEIRLLKKQLLEKSEGRNQEVKQSIPSVVVKEEEEEEEEENGKRAVNSPVRGINQIDDSVYKSNQEEITSSKLSKIFSSVDNDNTPKREKLDGHNLLLNAVNINAKKYDIVHTETLVGHNDSVLCCKFSKDGSLIASGGADCTVRIWDLKSWQDSLHIMGAILSQYDKASTSETNKDADNDENRPDLFSSSSTKNANEDVKEYNFWNKYDNDHLQQGSDPANFKGNNSFTDDNDRKNSPSHIPCHSTIYLSSETLCMDWTTSGPRKKPLLLFGTANHEVKVWDVNGQNLSTEFETDASCPCVKCVRYIPSSTGNVIIASNNRNNTYGKLEKWDITRKRVVCTLDLGGNNIVVNTMDVDPDGTKLIVGCNDGDIRVYDLRGSPVLMQRWKAHESNGDNGFVGGVTGVTLTHDGQVISSGGVNNEMVMWDVRNNDGVGVIRQYLTDDDHAVGNAVGKHYNNSTAGRTSIVSWAWADAKTLIRSSENGSAVLHRLARQRPVQYLHGHRSPVLSVSWTCPLGCPLNSCATSSHDNTVKLWALRKI